MKKMEAKMIKISLHYPCNLQLCLGGARSSCLCQSRNEYMFFIYSKRQTHGKMTIEPLASKKKQGLGAGPF